MLQSASPLHENSSVLRLYYFCREIRGSSALSQKHSSMHLLDNNPTKYKTETIPKHKLNIKNTGINNM